MTNVFKIDNDKEGNVTVAIFASKKEAQGRGNSGHIVTSMEDLSENFALTTSIMRDAYNIITSDKTVTRFSDRETACRRLWAAFVAQNGATPTSSPEKAAAKAAPERKAGAGKAPKKEKAPKAPKAKKASGEPRKGSRREVPLVVEKRTANPYRVATESHKTFELCADNPGKTFNEYVAMGGRANTMAGMLREGTLKQKA